MKPAIDNRTIRFAELIGAIIVVLASIFLMLAGLEIFPFSISECWVITVEICFFAISLVVAVMQNNSISWTACGALLSLIAAEILVLVGFAQRNVYPFYFLALPIGVAVGSISTKRFGIALKVALIFIGVGLMLFLESSLLLPTVVVLPAIALLLGGVGIVYSLVKIKRKNGEQEIKNS